MTPDPKLLSYAISPEDSLRVEHAIEFLVTHYVEWGAVGEAMFADAIKLYQAELANQI